MTALRAIASRFLPPLLLMAVIFWLSAQPGLNSGLGVWDTVLRKLAHMVEYGLLWFLWWRALGYGSPRPAIVIALAYAASDELHQNFVAERVGSPVDWAIDAAGIGLAGAAVVLRDRATRARKRRGGVEESGSPAQRRAAR
ncbi:MAG: VanZ family protein, partial [Chloroflexota bacterium]|nr:VanZ family protein [Chloroflexota bacterium]